MFNYALCLDRGYAFSGEKGNDKLITNSLMDRLEMAFRRQILPSDIADNDRINEETSNNSSLIGSVDGEKEKEKSSLLGMIGISKSPSPKGKDLKLLEQETLARGKIQKIEELPLMENMSDHTSSHLTNDLVSHHTLTDSKIMNDLGAPSSGNERSRAESKPSNTYSPKHSLKDGNPSSIEK